MAAGTKRCAMCCDNRDMCQINGLPGDWLVVLPPPAPLLLLSHNLCSLLINPERSPLRGKGFSRLPYCGPKTPRGNHISCTRQELNSAAPHKTKGHRQQPLVTASSLPWQARSVRCLCLNRFCKLHKVPYGYNCPSSSSTRLAGRGSVLFCALGEASSPSPPSSPMQGTMSHGASSLALNVSSDSEPELEGMTSVLV